MLEQPNSEKQDKDLIKAAIELSIQLTRAKQIALDKQARPGQLSLYVGPKPQNALQLEHILNKKKYTTYDYDYLIEELSRNTLKHDQLPSPFSMRLGYAMLGQNQVSTDDGVTYQNVDDFLAKYPMMHELDAIAKFGKHLVKCYEARDDYGVMAPLAGLFQNTAAAPLFHKPYSERKIVSMFDQHTFNTQVIISKFVRKAGCFNSYYGFLFDIESELGELLDNYNKRRDERPPLSFIWPLKSTLDDIVVFKEYITKRLFQLTEIKLRTGWSQALTYGELIDIEEVFGISPDKIKESVLPKSIAKLLSNEDWVFIQGQVCNALGYYKKHPEAIHNDDFKVLVSFSSKILNQHSKDIQSDIAKKSIPLAITTLLVAAGITALTLPGSAVFHACHGATEAAVLLECALAVTHIGFNSSELFDAVGHFHPHMESTLIGSLQQITNAAKKGTDVGPLIQKIAPERTTDKHEARPHHYPSVVDLPHDFLLPYYSRTRQAHDKSTLQERVSMSSKTKYRMCTGS